MRLERDVTDQRRMEEALASRTRELEKTQLQLEKLFEISREGRAKNSIPELIHFLHGVTLEIFPESEPMFFLLEAGKQQFLPLEECPPLSRSPRSACLEDWSNRDWRRILSSTWEQTKIPELSLLPRSTARFPL